MSWTAYRRGSENRVKLAGQQPHEGWAEKFHPQLTAADMPAMEMGAIAVQFLVERIAEPDAPPRQQLLAPPISLRNSTGPVPRATVTARPWRPDRR